MKKIFDFHQSKKRIFIKINRMKTIFLLILTSSFILFSCNQKEKVVEKSNLEIENAAIKTQTERLDSMYHINAVSKLPDYVNVEIDSMKVLSVIPIHGEDFRKNLTKPNFEFDVKNLESLKKLEKHIAENSDKSKPVIGYLTFLSYSTIVKEKGNLSNEQLKEFDKIKRIINGKQEGVNYLNKDLKRQNILSLSL